MNCERINMLFDDSNYKLQRSYMQHVQGIKSEIVAQMAVY